MIQWLLWAGAWFLIAHWISLYFSPEFVSRPGAHAILTLGIGAFGGVIIIGKWMLPIRYRHFHDYLD
ncbi:MAG: hypothetical protein R3242_01595 [Akkermansiaceae bacterium]|nr:hypothetical protein [Akkermansiaceae bacterium]